MQILVVDDDQAVRDSLKRSLEYSGYEVSTATDGVEALARLAVLRPDAVIMDVMMPRLDGLEATRSLRSAGNDVPILVLTARDAVGDRTTIWRSRLRSTSCWRGFEPWSGGPAPSPIRLIRQPETSSSRI